MTTKLRFKIFLTIKNLLAFMKATFPDRFRRLGIYRQNGIAFFIKTLDIILNYIFEIEIIIA